MMKISSDTVAFRVGGEESETDTLQGFSGDIDESCDDAVDAVDAVASDGTILHEHYRYVADKGQSLLRIDKYLVAQMGNVSRNRVQEAADAERIWVNGTPVKSNYRVKPCDVIQVMLDKPKDRTVIIPQDIPVDIVYEDDALMVINKQPGLVVHPGFGNWDGTLLNAVAWHLRDNESFDANNPHIGLVHRIDKDTSGLIAIAKTEEAKADLGLQFFNKTTDRTYNALVWGVLREDTGTITGALARDPRDRMLFTVVDQEENPAAKHAVTHYRVIERFAYCTLVECRLETGRTHQIRVHMRYIGHTLFNDERYGGNEPLKGKPTAKYRQFVRNCFEICPRQALHAKTLGFTHPVTGQRMQFDSQLPADFSALIEKWRRYNDLGQTDE